MSKTALITGVTGQDGAYLSEFLLDQGYQVHGIKRRASLLNTQRVDHLYRDPHIDNHRFVLHYGDMTDSMALVRVINQVQPNEIYNLAAQSHVHVSFEAPEYTANADALGALRILEALRILNMEKEVRFYQASTSEIYGGQGNGPLDENSPFMPRSPYATAKLYAYWTTVNYREAYGMFAANGILFNHESPLRGVTFSTRKITRGVADIQVGNSDCLYMGNLDAKRDWGHARDYVEGMWKILQHEKAEDFVLATGRQESVRWFIEQAFKVVGVEIEWRGEGEAETGVERESERVLVRIDPHYFRPLEVNSLLGNPAKAKKLLQWEPRCTLEEMVEEMVKEDLERSRDRDQHAKYTI